MTDTEEARELTIEEQTHAVLANALDQLSNETPGGKVRWATTTLPAMLNLVIVDLDRHAVLRVRTSRLSGVACAAGVVHPLRNRDHVIALLDSESR
jgi:hypothetical protein